MSSQNSISQQEFLELLNQTNSPVISERQIAEEKLMNLFQTSLIEFVSALWKAIQDGTSSSMVRLCAFILLRKHVFEGDDVWKQLPVTLQDDIRNNFIDILVNCPKEGPILKNLIEQFHKIVDTVTSNDSTMLSRKWPGLFTKLIELFQSGDASKMCVSLKLIRNLCENAFEYLENNSTELDGLVKVSLNHQDYTIISEAVRIWCHIILNGEKDVIKKLTVKANLIIPAAFQVVKNDSDLAEDTLECLDSTIRCEPKRFKSHYVLLRDVVFEVLEQEGVSGGIKGFSFEALLVLIEETNILKKHTDLEKLLNCTIKQLAAICEEADPEWCKPFEGFYEGDEENESDEKNWRTCADRLLQANSSDSDSTHEIICKLIKDQGTNCTWKEQYALLMIVSQVGEYLDVNSLDEVIEFGLNSYKHENPKVRYAATHFFGQIAEDQEEEFHEKYVDKLIPQMILWFDDPVDRVKEHAMTALGNFLEKCEEEIQAKYVDTIIEKSCAFLEGSEISIVKESAIILLTSIAEKCEEALEKHITKTTNLTIEVIVNKTQVEYELMRMLAIEYCTLICDSFGEDKFGQKNLETLLSVMIKIQKAEHPPNWYNKMAQYMLSGWHRLAMILKEKFVSHLTEIGSSLFNTLKEIMNAESIELESLGVGLKMLEGIMENVGGAFGPYINDTLQICYNLLHSQLVTEYEDLFNTIKSAIKCLRLDTNPEATTTFRGTSNAILKDLIGFVKRKSNEDDITNSSLAFSIIGDIIQESEIQFLNADTLELITQTADHQLQKTFETIETHKDKDGDDDDENEDEAEHEELDALMDYCEYIADTVGQILKHHSQEMLPYIEKLVSSKIIVDNLQPGKPVTFSLFLVSDILERCSGDPLNSQWPTIYPKILTFSRDPLPKIRHTSNFIIGILASKHKAKFDANMKEYVKALIEAIDNKTAESEQDKDDLVDCQENVCAAIGKVIKSDPSIVNKPGIKEMKIVNKWLSNLPLENDLDEALDQHELFCDVLLSSAEVVLGGNDKEIAKNLEYVITTFGKIHKSKEICNDAILGKLKKVLEHLRDVERHQKVISSKIAEAHPEVVQELLGLLSEE